MLNHVVFVGRLVNWIDYDQCIEVETHNVDESIIRMPVKLTSTMYDKSKQYATIGDIMGIKGKLKNMYNQTIIEAERITFLSGRAAAENGGEIDGSREI